MQRRDRIVSPGLVIRFAVIVAALVAMAKGLDASVFWVVVVLNLVLGVSEAVPLSAYGMFASPAESAWVVRVEGPDGGLVPIGAFGVPPGNAHKRFSAVEQAALVSGSDASQARAAATDDLVDWISTQRVGHPLASAELHLVHTMWRIVDGSVLVEREHLATVAPA